MAPQDSYLSEQYVTIKIRKQFNVHRSFADKKYFVFVRVLRHEELKQLKNKN